MTIVNGVQPSTIITKHSILDVAVALDPPLNKWQNVNRRPYHEHIFLKQIFSANF